MKIIIGMGHPKDVHFWKNIINNLENDGHEIKIMAWDKDVTLYLLDVYGFSYETLGKGCKSLMGKMYKLCKSELISIKIAKEFKPDFLVGREPCLAHISKLIKKPFIMLSDTEHATLAHRLTYPFSDAICTPSCFKKKINPKKHITFDGYQELAYLHPNYFKPDPKALFDLELSEDDPFIVLRFVSWSASHDVGQYGIADKEEFVRALEKYGQVFITSEAKLRKSFERYRINIGPEKMHDLLYYATMYVGEGATMATESGILGTPSIYISSLVGTMGNFEELEKRYNIVYSFRDSKDALKKALQLLEENNLKRKWKNKRERLLEEKIDVTEFMTGFIENYQNFIR